VANFLDKKISLLLRIFILSSSVLLVFIEAECAQSCLMADCILEVSCLSQTSAGDEKVIFKFSIEESDYFISEAATMRMLRSFTSLHSG
jgi:hypothetical protein